MYFAALFLIFSPLAASSDEYRPTYMDRFGNGYDPSLDEVQNSTSTSPRMKLQNELCDAIQNNDTTAVKRLLQPGRPVANFSEYADVNAFDEMKRLPLQVTMDQNNLPLGLFLMQNDAHPYTNMGNYSLLLYAVKTRKYNFVRLLARNGAFMRNTDLWGLNGLFYAVLNNDVKMAKLLLELGVGWDQPDNWGNLCIHLVFHNHQVELAALILAYGGDPFSLNAFYQTAISLLDTKRPEGKKILQMIDYYHANPTGYRVPNPTKMPTPHYYSPPPTRKLLQLEETEPSTVSEKILSMRERAESLAEEMAKIFFPKKDGKKDVLDFIVRNYCPKKALK